MAVILSAAFVVLCITVVVQTVLWVINDRKLAHAQDVFMQIHESDIRAYNERLKHEARSRKEKSRDSD